MDRIQLRNGSKSVSLRFESSNAMAIVSNAMAKAFIIQYGYRNCETDARVFSQTLMHGNSKNEKRQTEDGKMKGVSMKSERRTQKEEFQLPNYSLSLPSQRVSPRREAVD